MKKIQQYHTKGLAIIMVALLAFGLNSCKKDLPKTKDSCCQFEGVLTGYPQGCLPSNENKLVIFDGANYFAIAEDLTGKYKGLRKGQKVCFNYELVEPCNHVFVAGVQGIAAIPVACIKLTCLTKLDEDKGCECDDGNSCIPQKFITYSQYRWKSNNPYLIHEGRVVGDQLVLKIGYSGCNREDMTFEVAQGPTAGPLPVYFGRLEYPKTACEMYILEDLCIDISRFPANSIITIADSDGSKSYRK